MEILNQTDPKDTRKLYESERIKKEWQTTTEFVGILNRYQFKQKAPLSKDDGAFCFIRGLNVFWTKVGEQGFDLSFV